GSRLRQAEHRLSRDRLLFWGVRGNSDTLTRNAHLDLARGGVREGLTAIHNLAELLRSRRVAARALASAVHDVRDGAHHIATALSDLERAALAPLAAEGVFAATISGLFVDARARVAELAGVLDRLGTASFDARRRLTLEQALRPVAAVVEAALVVV